MSEKIYISKGKGLPEWSNPISHAVVANNMCFVSGQLSVNAQGEYINQSILDEGKLAFANFFAVLNSAGFEKDDIVFIDIAFNNLEDLSVINTLYCELFEEHKRPARTVYQAQKLPFGGKIKVTGTAVKDIKQ
ncbi:MAG: RidA family protein [Marinicellaceae bacterium]